MPSLNAELRMELIDGVSKPARSVAEALAQADKRVREISKDMQATGASDKLTTALAKLKTQKVDIETVASAWKSYAKASNLAADSSKWTTTEAASVKAWERQTLQSVRAVIRERAAEANAERQQMRKLAQEAETHHKQMHKWFGGESSMAAAIGAAALGAKMDEAARESLGLGMTTGERIAQLKAAGAKDDEIAEARARFREFSKSHAGVRESDYLATTKDARVIAPGEANEMAEAGALFKVALRNSGVKATEHDVGNVLRIMDELGLKTNAERMSLLDNITKQMQTFGEQIPTETMLSAYRNAKQAIYGWSPDFRNKYFPTLMQMSGEQGGTEIMTGYNNWVGHHLSHAELKAMAAAGFADNKDLMYNKTGDIKGVKPGAHLYKEDQFKSDPAQWSWDFHKNFMARPGATEKKFEDLIATMPRNMAALISGFVHNEQRFKRDADTIDKATGIKAADNATLSENPVASLAALKESIEQFGSALTSPAMSKAGGLLTSLAQGIQSVSAAYGEWAKNNPTAADVIGAGAGVGGVVAGKGLEYGGMLALLKGGFGLSASATELSGAAAALTTAAEILKGEAVVDSVTNPKGGGLWGKLKALGAGAMPFIKGAWPIGVATGVKEGADYLDPGGNFGGLTDPFDSWSKAHFGFDPSKVPSPSFSMPKMREAPYSFADEITGGAGGLNAQINVDASALDAVKPKADAAKAALDPLSQTIPMSVDTSAAQAAIDALIAKAGQLRAALAGAAGAAGAVKLPSLGSTMRNNFSSSGQSGE